MSETKTTTKKATTKKPMESKAAPKTPSIVKMVHDDGRTADVHPSMVDAYKSGGYREA